MTEIPNHEAMSYVEPQVEALRHEHDLSGELTIRAGERIRTAKDELDRISEVVGEDALDETVAGYVDDAVDAADATEKDVQAAVNVGVVEVFEHAEESKLTARELGETPLENLEGALRDLHDTQGEGAVEAVVDSIEEMEAAAHAHEGLKPPTSIPEFDRLDNYSPEFEKQLLLHRSNAELKPGDIVLPSDKISGEMHDQLNRGRSFTATSSPHGSGGYDRQLAHAGTRDFGEIYGKYLYVVEPLEGDTLKWGENFGASVNRGKKIESPAIDSSNGQPAMTDSYTGKKHNEVVSINGFRVVERIAHEPAYEETMLPWPVSPDAVQKRKDRRENGMYSLMHDEGHTVKGFLRTTSRPKPGKIGAVDRPGTYRAGASDQIAANLQTKFDVRKQKTEHPGQSAFPDMPIAKFRTKDIKADELGPSYDAQSQPRDDTLPGMDDFAPPPPPMM